MRLPFENRSKLQSSGFSLAADKIELLLSAKAFSQRLLSLIQTAKSRIYLTALYLQDDDAGRQVLDALYRAVRVNPQLDICIFVDYHRAQRGLIGEKQCLGNRALYQELAATAPDQVKIYGVPVKGKELFGVLHLKGFVFDDVLLYSGASINDVYLHQHDKYRYDRYYQFSHGPLADTFVSFLMDNFVKSGCAPRLDVTETVSKKQLKKLISRLARLAKKGGYQLPANDSDTGEIKVTPLLGFGKRSNSLNLATRNLIKQADESIILITPYFNLPKSLKADLAQALKRGVSVKLVVGDKTANDFYLSPDKPFSTIGIVPYLYERLLVKFVYRFQRYLQRGQLEVNLWCDQDNSFHLKGLIVDERQHLITGSNMNPRAWSLDMENGLLVQDEQQRLKGKWQPELETILRNTERVKGVDSIETIADYPSQPQALLKKLKMAQIDRLLKRFL